MTALDKSQKRLDEEKPAGAKTFSKSKAFILGTRDEQAISCFCPKCALERMRAISTDAGEISYVETVAESRGRCSSCGTFPLETTAEEALTQVLLLEFMGRVMRMAEREQKARSLNKGRDF